MIYIWQARELTLPGEHLAGLANKFGFGLFFFFLLVISANVFVREGGKQNPGNPDQNKKMSARISWWFVQKSLMNSWQKMQIQLYVDVMISNN